MVQVILRMYDLDEAMPHVKSWEKAIQVKAESLLQPNTGKLEKLVPRLWKSIANRKDRIDLGNNRTALSKLGCPIPKSVLTIPNFLIFSKGYKN